MRQKFRTPTLFLIAAATLGALFFTSANHLFQIQERGSWNGTLMCRRSTFRPDSRPCRLIVRIGDSDWEVEETDELRALHRSNKALPVTIAGVRQHATWLTRNEIFSSSVRPLAASHL